MPTLDLESDDDSSEELESKKSEEAEAPHDVLSAINEHQDDDKQTEKDSSS
jgi:hypothetical protein